MGSVNWERVVALNVRRLRKARGLTQEQLALTAEIAMRYVGMLERGEASATVNMLGKLAAVFDVNPAEFFSEVEASGGSVPSDNDSES